MLAFMYSARKLVAQKDYWSDILLMRDWTMLKKISIGNYANTQRLVKSMMITSTYSSISIGHN